jgi:hypothetical protein
VLSLMCWRYWAKLLSNWCDALQSVTVWHIAWNGLLGRKPGLAPAHQASRCKVQFLLLL